MLKVGLFFIGKINALTGASTVIRNIIQGFNESKSIDLWSYMLDLDGKPINDSIISVPNNGKKINVIRLKIHEFLGKYSKKNIWIAKFYVFLLYRKNVNRVICKYGQKAEEMDVLFFHEYFTPYFLRKKNQEVWNKKKKVIVLHNNGEILNMFFSYFPVLEKNKKTRNYYINLAKTVLNEVDEIVLLSEYAKRNFLKDNKVYENKVSIIPNGLNFGNLEKKSSENSDKIIIVTVGTVSKRKGHDIIVDTLQLMSKEERDLFEIRVLGGGNILNSLKLKCEENKIDNINFIGMSTEVKRHLLESDVFLLASRDEGLPMAIIEAMACSLPILSTRVGGIPDLIDNTKNGWLIEPDVNELKNTIQSIIKGNFNLKKMGVHSRKMYEANYTQSKMIQGYQSIFEKLAQEK